MHGPLLAAAVGAEGFASTPTGSCIARGIIVVGRRDYKRSLRGNGRA